MKKNKQLEIAKAIYLIIIIVILKVIFIIPRLCIWLVKCIEKSLSIVRKTLTYLIELIESEVIN